MPAVVPGDDLEVMLKGVLEVFPKKGGNAHPVAKHYGKTQSHRLIINRSSVGTFGESFLQAKELSQFSGVFLTKRS